MPVREMYGLGAGGATEGEREGERRRGREGDVQSKNERELKAKVKKPWKEKQKKMLLSQCGDLRGRHEKTEVFFFCFLFRFLRV